jgi:hypothetical protein
MPNYDFSSIPKSASSALYGLREPEPQTSKAQTTRIYPIPDLPKSASSALYFLRKSEEARAIRSSQPIVDFTAQEQLPVNNAASAFFKDFEYFNYEMIIV